MQTEYSLSGLSALVTGGTRGIGKAISEEFLNSQAKVWITGRRKTGEISAEVNFIEVDFTNESELHDFSNLVRTLNIDILVNNAGINRISPFQDISLEVFDSLHDVNTRAPLVICQSVLSHMKKQKWGRIVNISSIFGKISRKDRASYSASKFALDGLSTALAVEVAADGILVNCVAPGFIDTELTQSILGKSGMEKLALEIPLGRLGSPKEIAKLVLFLSSRENTYLCGQNIVIDGGFSRV